MDSGAPRPETAHLPTFNPFMPLLPEEVCWILDRTFACEVNAHDGLCMSDDVWLFNALAYVFSCDR